MQYPLPPNRLSIAAIRSSSTFRSPLSRSFSAFPTTRTSWIAADPNTDPRAISKYRRRSAAAAFPLQAVQIEIGSGRSISVKADAVCKISCRLSQIIRCHL